MRDKTRLVLLALVVWPVPMPLFSLPAEANDSSVEEGVANSAVRHGCIASHLIRRVTFDDDRTGTLELVGQRRVRLTLKTSCSGIRFNGYVHKPVNRRFCEGDILRVMGSGGFCMVETLELLARDEVPAVSSDQPAESR